MKKLSIAPVMVFIVASPAAAAYENKNINILVDTDFNVKALKGLCVEVSAVNIQGSSVIEIRDEDGYALYKEEVGGEAYIKKFDLSALPEGNYRVLLISGERSMFRAFGIQAESSISALAS